MFAVWTEDFERLNGREEVVFFALLQFSHAEPAAILVHAFNDMRSTNKYFALKYRRLTPTLSNYWIV